tara:strand:+ start:246 stop:524 length:279 start_codon:yes stop_codon:yes gene_type:complete
MGVFSSANASTGIKIRLDDKLKRIANAGLVEDTEDTLIDIAGYIILLMIAKDNESNDIQKRIRERSATSHTDIKSSDEDTVGEVWFSHQSNT